MSMHKYNPISEPLTLDSVARLLARMWARILNLGSKTPSWTSLNSWTGVCPVPRPGPCRWWSGWTRLTTTTFKSCPLWVRLPWGKLLGSTRTPRRTVSTRADQVICQPLQVHCVLKQAQYDCFRNLRCDSGRWGNPQHPPSDGWWLLPICPDVLRDDLRGAQLLHHWPLGEDLDPDGELRSSRAAGEDPGPGKEA